MTAVEQAEFYYEDVDELAQAQEMAAWFSDYVFGFTDELGELPTLSTERLEDHFPDTEIKVQLDAVKDALMRADPEIQPAIALYICGYPVDAIKTLSDVAPSAIVTELNNRLPKRSEPATVKKIVRRPAAIKPTRRKAAPELTDDEDQAKSGKKEADLDNLGLLFKDAKRFPLLSAEQEVELAKKIEAGVLAQEELDVGEIDPESLYGIELTTRISEGKAAKDLFISSNVKLVASVARYYKAGRGVEYDDRISMGMEGLIRAVEKFDYQKGFKFSTYAMWWIKQAITRGVMNESRTVRIPVHAGEDLDKMFRARIEMMKLLNREPTDEELSEEVGFDVVKLKDNVRAAIGTVSLNMLLGEDGETELGDLIARTEGTEEREEVDNSLLRQKMIDILYDTLTEGEADVMIRRMGLNGEEPMTLDEIGSVRGVTRERIRQIEIKAKAKLEKDPFLKSLAREEYDMDTTGERFQGIATEERKKGRRSRGDMQRFLLALQENADLFTDDERLIASTYAIRGTHDKTAAEVGCSSSKVAYVMVGICQKLGFRWGEV